MFFPWKLRMKIVLIKPCDTKSWIPLLIGMSLWRVMCLCGLGSFLLQDMLLNLPAFAFEGQNKKFTVNMSLTGLHSISIETPGPVVWSELFASTICRFLSRTSYLSSYFFLRRHRSSTSRKLCVCLPLLTFFLHLSGRSYVAQCFRYS